MATYHGMCKNCGSLITIDDSKENCECVFCHCVFPRDEYSYQNKEKTNFDVESFTEDKAEWQYDSAQKEYCRQTGKSPAELTEQDEKIIWDYAGIIQLFSVPGYSDTIILEKCITKIHTNKRILRR